MKLRKIVCSLAVLIVLIISSVCLAQQPSTDEIKKFADPMTENILVAMNNDDYPRFSRDFDEPMRNGMSETFYKITFPTIKAKIGKYISKEFLSVEHKDQYTEVIYKAKFTQEPADVIVISYFSDQNGKKYISGFWLDSPKLRGK